MKDKIYSNLKSVEIPKPVGVPKLITFKLTIGYSLCVNEELVHAGLFSH